MEKIIIPKLHNADCFDIFPFIEDKSIDAIICDLPYGTTACKWDTILPFDKLWKEYEYKGEVTRFTKPIKQDEINLSLHKSILYLHKKIFGN
jgi:hypothetical protein